MIGDDVGDIAEPETPFPIDEEDVIDTVEPETQISNYEEAPIFYDDPGDGLGDEGQRAAMHELSLREIQNKDAESDLEHARQLKNFRESDDKYRPRKLRIVGKHYRHYNLSDQVHILGMDVTCRFLAHSLASVPGLPPPVLLSGNKSLQRNWAAEHRSIAMYDTRRALVSVQPILCPENYKEFGAGQGEDRKISNLMVTASRPGMFRSLRLLRERIDNTTTLCLMDDGLGMIEKLNEEVFTDEGLRPNYVLAHTTHRLRKHNLDSLAFRKDMEHNGVFYFSMATNEKRRPLYERHLRGILSTNPNINPVGLTWPNFLRVKLLDKMIFESTSDALSVCLGQRFDQIWKDRHTMRLWSDLLLETLNIIAHLPEYPEADKKHRFNRSRMDYLMREKLKKQGKTHSHWVARVKLGYNTKVDTMNAYFVKRAKEVGVSHELNSWVWETIKSRVSARRHELDQDIPVHPTPYMSDGDVLGGFPGGFSDRVPLMNENGDY